MLINALRGHLAEFGIIAHKGQGGLRVRLKRCMTPKTLCPRRHVLRWTVLLINFAYSEQRLGGSNHASPHSTLPTMSAGG